MLTPRGSVQLNPFPVKVKENEKGYSLPLPPQWCRTSFLLLGISLPPTPHPFTQRKRSTSASRHVPSQHRPSDITNGIMWWHLLSHIQTPRWWWQRWNWAIYHHNNRVCDSVVVSRRLVLLESGMMHGELKTTISTHDNHPLSVIKDDCILYYYHAVGGTVLSGWAPS